MNDWGAGLTFAAILFLVGVLGSSLVEGYQQTKLERFCLAHGYARADWRWVGDNYCITRTDQTDIVVPQNKVK